MKRKLWLSVAMLAIGAGLLVAAGFASTASSGTAKAGAAKAGGTLRLSKSTDIDYVDPALAYFTDSWELEYITCAKIMNYPDKPGAAGAQVVPEVAQSYKVSKDGKTYTFVLKKTYKYNTGRTLTAADFQYAMNRDADPKMQSPATAYMHEIVGADAVIDGKASSISGIVAKGNVLTVKLTKSLPDFLARLTMPFFCPLPPGTPHDPDGINNPAGSGPYYIASRQVNRQIITKKNPNYKGPRPHNVDQIIETIGPTLEACRLETEQNAVDYCVDGVPPASYKDIADKYGIKGATGNGQFFFNTLLGTSYFALNNNRPAFKGNLSLRKAVNQGVDRPALVRAGGYLGGKRTDQILPPSMTTDANIYPIKGAAPAAAKKLASGHMPPGNQLTLYTANRGARVIRAQVFQFNMKQIGIDVNVTQFARAVQHAKCGTLNEPFDVCDEGWIVDYADPVTFFEPLLLGTNIHDTENTDEAYFNDPKWNKAIVAAGRLTGAARSKAYAALDINITKQAAPWASFLTLTNRDFVSKSTGCYMYHPVFLMDWAVTCKK
jgi:ABC-type oligopeptide transport system substrate-binding subunit